MRSVTSNTSDGSPRSHTSSDRLEGGGIWVRLIVAWLSALGLVAVELVLILPSAAHALTGIWELQVGLVSLLPAWALLSLAPAASAVGLAHVLTHPRPLSPKSRVLLGMGVGVFAGAVGWGVGGGRHLADPGLRSGFAVALGLSGAGVAVVCLDALRRAIVRAPAWTRNLVLLVLLVAVEAINRWVLVRLYPAFHWGLSYVGLTLFALFVVLNHDLKISKNLHLKNTFKYWITFALFCLILATSLLLLPWGSRRIATFDNLRFLLSEGPPTLALGVELASHVAPPPTLDAQALALPLGATRSQKVDHTSLAGRSILLISIDALRADHLGCYGYGRPTTPAMDQLAKAGVRYNAAYSPTPHTSYSVTSLMSGKYMRPLLLQDTGHDSELWATLLQTYGYRTAAFYPPAIFFIDQQRFAAFEQKKLGFEYAKVEFAEGEKRLGQVRSYVKDAPPGRPLFVWVHLFGPHEPYVQQPEAHFGDHDLDRYDSEVRAADATVAGLVDIVRQHDPQALVVLTADHGEEFGDHGGRYHGTSVYDEQVRVPLIISGPGLPQGRVVERPVQTIDLLPTFLDGLDLLIPPRIRGRSLLADLNVKSTSEPSPDPGLAIAETDEYTLLAEGNERLICQRRSGACRLFDIQADPRQLRDISSDRADRTQALKTKARAIAETHGRYETQGLRKTGRGWPTAIVLGMSGNADVAPELARLLDDADVEVRRKAAELLFELGQADQTPALRLALGREEDPHVRSWLGLALTRLGEGAPLVVELLHAPDPQLRRTAALVLAEQGNDAGETELIRWFLDVDHRPEPTALAILKALARIRSEEAVPFLLAQLKDVRLRPAIAQALAQIGDKDARGPLAVALRGERFHSARAKLTEALLDLGAKEELVLPLRHFMGVPDPIPGGLQFALRAGILDQVGGPKATDLRRLRQLGESGVRVSVVVPPIDVKHERTNGGARLIVLLRSRSPLGGQLLVQAGLPEWGKKSTFSKKPEIDASQAVTIHWPPTPLEAGGLTALRELSVDVPDDFKVQPGHNLVLEVYAAGDLELRALAVVPKRAELPPPPPKPWVGTLKDEQSEEETGADAHAP